jgi:lipopolysaccharide biosynthesis regulator YciM
MGKFKRLLIGTMAAVVLMALLSVTLLNKHSPFMRMTSLMREGRIAMEEYDFYEAIDIYKLALSINDRRVKTYLELTEAFRRTGDLEDAKYYLEMGMRKTNSDKLRRVYNNLLREMGLAEENGDED